jgi:cellulose biosynthesis protein BcsQ
MGFLGALIIGIFIAKGGNAKTTIALEMAYYFRKIWQKSVLLIDLVS